MEQSHTRNLLLCGQLLLILILVILENEHLVNICEMAFSDFTKVADLHHP